MARYQRPIVSWTWSYERSVDEPVAADISAIEQALAALGDYFDPQSFREFGGLRRSGRVDRTTAADRARQVLEPLGDILLHIGGALRLRSEAGRTRVLPEAGALIVGDGSVCFEVMVDDVLPAALNGTPHSALHKANAPRLREALQALSAAFGSAPEGEEGDWATATPTGAENLRSVTGGIYVPPWLFAA